MSLSTYKFIFVFLCAFIVQNATFAQTTTLESTENEQLFTDKDKDFFQLWYYDQVLKMQLDEEARGDYLALLQYYTFKMTRLGLAKYNYTDAEQKMKFDQLVKKMNAEMMDYLSNANYMIHKQSFTKIEDAVYKKKNWKK